MRSLLSHGVNFEVVHSVHSRNIKHPLIISTICTLFIHYVYSHNLITIHDFK